uniref:Cell cycle checkpoint control protein RAD9A n=1 Tax=Oryzias sinensis TaxID=183150 RepID=A0A8C7WSV6_9TELE
MLFRKCSDTRAFIIFLLFVVVFFWACQSVQSVFRSLATLEKTVEKCHIELNEQKDRLTFTLHCKHGLLKTHNLSYQDSESLQAVFNKDTCTNEFRAQPRVLVDTVAHFPPSLEEVTVTVSDERMWVRNHVEDETGNTTVVFRRKRQMVA